MRNCSLKTKEDLKLNLSSLEHENTAHLNPSQQDASNQSICIESGDIGHNYILKVLEKDYKIKIESGKILCKNEQELMLLFNIRIY